MCTRIYKDLSIKADLAAYMGNGLRNMELNRRHTPVSDYRRQNYLNIIHNLRSNNADKFCDYFVCAVNR